MLGDLKMQIAKQWVIPDKLRCEFATYFLRIWNTDYVTSLLEAPFIVYEGYCYEIILRRPHKGMPDKEKIAVSFRRPLAQSYGYLIIGN
jgi:hypothetical protein